MTLLCKLVGHKIVTRKLECQDGSVMFVNRCKRWPCRHVETRMLTPYMVQAIQHSVQLTGKSVEELLG